MGHRAEWTGTVKMKKWGSLARRTSLISLPQLPVCDLEIHLSFRSNQLCNAAFRAKETLHFESRHQPIGACPDLVALPFTTRATSMLSAIHMQLC